MLVIKDLMVNYGKITALKEINLRVYPGEIIAIIGANGAGKSTLLRAISGLVKPKAGSILLNCKEVGGKPAPQITNAGIAHIPEGRQLFPEMTVAENLELGGLVLNNYKNVKENMSEIYELFPALKERAKQKAKTLSGGEQQMVAIGRGLMSEPDLILFDEPSLGLAPIVVEKLGEVINNLHRKGMTIVLVEQNAYMALQLADRAYVLENGQITLSGESQELLQDGHVLKAYLGG